MYKEPKQVINWADEQPFFDFDVPHGGLIIFEGGSVTAVEKGLINNFENNDGLIPLARLTDKEDPYIQELEAGKPAEYQNMTIECVIIPIRYRKVFKA